ncbi:T9SS type A sorting domain-containing protein [Rubricoccus marinus]|uniref:Secretion system C-terminal sorting domain-containing protein n=1 Tax=Rubricoccus marinus TaxID=716817 RepID=A0A259TVB1_9BACT|nr:T9SS type A sorting domain-containing protein [Rubricoccus marinus]OZC01636.1 hypothetical protein BSZ36_00745 [Rubricoccus marinus]
MLRAALFLALFALPAMASGAQTCALGTAEARLRGVDVEAALFTNGNLFYGNQTTDGSGYVTPLGENALNGQPRSPVFASTLWLGGKVGGDIRASAARYTNFVFRPGQTGADHVPPDSTACAEADRIWVVSRDDIAAYYAGATPEADLAEWPVHLGAPVLDGDGIAGNYDLEAGDQPAIRGDVMAFWAMTDMASGTPFGETAAGVDVAAEAFAIRTSPFRDETFYRFTITNRNGTPLDSAYVGLHHDFDIGERTNDRIGTDTTAQMLYVYNGTDTDPFFNGAPPAHGVVVARGPVGLANGRDDDGDGTVDEPGEPLGLTGSALYALTCPHCTSGDPDGVFQFYNYLQGRWGDGSVMRANGNGYRQPAQYPRTRFLYAGDPVSGEGWSEVNADGAGTPIPAGDRRGIPGSGPFRLLPDSSTSVTFALVYAQGTDRFDSITHLRSDARRVLAAQASGAFEPSRVEGFEPRQRPLAVSRPRPNPFREATTILIQAPANTAVQVSVYDALGRRLSVSDAETPEARVEIGRGLAPGVYVVRVEGAGFAETFTAVKTR